MGARQIGYYTSLASPVRSSKMSRLSSIETNADKEKRIQTISPTTRVLASPVMTASSETQYLRTTMMIDDPLAGGLVPITDGPQIKW